MHYYTLPYCINVDECIITACKVVSETLDIFSFRNRI